MKYNDEAPVLLARTGDDEVTVLAYGRPDESWTPLKSTDLGPLAGLLGALQPTGGAGQQDLSARVFTMRKEDLPHWDRFNKSDASGYAYGTLRGTDNKYCKNVAIREVDRGQLAGGLPPMDPLTIANAVALAQIQASIEELTRLVEEVKLDLKAVLEHLQIRQQAEVLAAVETIDELYASYRVNGRVASTDWDRIAQLEQLIKTQHRQILAELESTAEKLRFKTIDQARGALKITEDRVKDLLRLEFYLLRAFTRWAELMLTTKGQRGELTLRNVRATRSRVDSYVVHAQAALDQLRSTRTKLNGRHLFDRLMSDGLVRGSWNDDKVKKAALTRRRSIRKAVATTKLTALVTEGVLALDPALEAPSGAVALGEARA